MRNLCIERGNVLKGFKLYIWLYNKLVLIVYVYNISFKLKIYVGSFIMWDKSENRKNRKIYENYFLE